MDVTTGYDCPRCSTRREHTHKSPCVWFQSLLSHPIHQAHCLLNLPRLCATIHHAIIQHQVPPRRLFEDLLCASNIPFPRIHPLHCCRHLNILAEPCLDAEPMH
uniref:Uncharacterized protein n=1 Tax=Triticum urartu TaxID=4572 RepID=A0A8R7TEG7_TRIUA